MQFDNASRQYSSLRNTTNTCMCPAAYINRACL